jgi:hypothetical protein
MRQEAFSRDLRPSLLSPQDRVIPRSIQLLMKKHQMENIFQTL